METEWVTSTSYMLMPFILLGQHIIRANEIIRVSQAKTSIQVVTTSDTFDAHYNDVGSCNEAWSKLKEQLGVK
jgi:hypothetical protein